MPAPTFTPGTYAPPGVYVSETPAVLPTVATFAPAVLAIVGPGLGYEVNTEAVTLNGTTATALAHLGINTTTIIVQKANGTTAATSDYTIVQSAGADGNINNIPDNPTTIARAGGSTISDGETVLVSYQYTDASYSAPLSVSDYPSVVSAFGAPLDPVTGAVVSPLSLAAKIAFDNGANNIVLVATPGTATSVAVGDLNTAYTALLAHPEVTLVCPITTGIVGTTSSIGDAGTALTNLAAHVTTAATQGLYRMGVIGFGLTVTATPQALAAQADSSRVILAWPNQVNYATQVSGITTSLDGSYLAMGYAGRLAALAPNIPLTRKTISTFSGFSPTVAATMTQPNKNSWSQAGVAVAEVNRTGGMWVRHGVATDTTSTITREPSITRSKDAVMGIIETTIESSGIIGSPLTADMGVRVQGLIQGCLETAKGQTYIIAYSPITVTQQSVDPSILVAQFSYKPTWPLNYIVLSFSLDTSTGVLTQNLQQIGTT